MYIHTCSTFIYIYMYVYLYLYISTPTMYKVLWRFCYVKTSQFIDRFLNFLWQQIVELFPMPFTYSSSSSSSSSALKDNFAVFLVSALLSFSPLLWFVALSDFDGVGDEDANAASEPSIGLWRFRKTMGWFKSAGASAASIK